MSSARKQGDTKQRLALVAAWEEAGGLFSAQERAATRMKAPRR